jgi:predicted GIY-YIG superfamily endonuclease
MEWQYFVYILASKRNGTLYVGITNDISRRVWEHQEGMIEGLRRSTTSRRSSITRASSASTTPSLSKSD